METPFDFKSNPNGFGNRLDIAQDVPHGHGVEQNLKQQFYDLLEIEAKLSERDKFVLSGVIIGKLNRVIARELDMSERTIEKIRARLIKTFGVETIAQVIAKTAELNILRVLASVSKIMPSNPVFDENSLAT